MQKCELTGKGKQFGNNISFSQRHTKKVWKPNLQTKTFMVDGKKVTMKLSTQAIRTLKKKGILTSTYGASTEQVVASEATAKTAVKKTVSKK